MIFDQVGLNNVYLVAALYCSSRSNYYCQYAELVGHKKDILSLLNSEEKFQPEGHSYSFPSIAGNSTKIFTTKLPSGLFHCCIIGHGNLLISTKSLDILPRTQLFNYLDKNNDIPLLLSWMPHISSELITAKGITPYGCYFGGIYGWDIWHADPKKLSVIIERGLKAGKISATKVRIIDEYSVPEYGIDKKGLAGLRIPKKDKLALKEITTDGLWAKGVMQSYLTKPATHIPAPVMPLRNGHVGLIFASGNLNNAILDNGKEKVLIKYSAEKLLMDKSKEKDKEVKREYMRSIIKYVDFADNTIKIIQSDQI